MSRPSSRRDFLRQFVEPPRKAEATGVTRTSSLTAEQELSRFLAQATLGADKPLIDYVLSLDPNPTPDPLVAIDAWISEQFSLPKSDILAYFYANVYNESDIGSDNWPQQELFRYTLWDTILKGNDLLRQRVALALSEIMVISTEPDEIYNAANGVADWYDMLLRNAFGNFRDLLFDVTVHPVMGFYLSHASNRKTNEIENIFPDENYAREVMQLFTIGLFLLNEDGSLILDGNNEPIPTYDNSHITEFAKIFTGLTYDAVDDPHITWQVFFGSGWLNSYTSVRPMVMWDEEHEPGEKHLLNGYVVPSGQTGMQDLNDALDNLFNHPNVGPFIGRLLIQRLVKSNPSPAYIGRVTVAFNDNGSGVRGDMQAVIKAILLDDEARNTSFITDPHNGKLREPFFRFAQLLRTFHFANPQMKYWDAGWSVSSELRQFMFTPPSVFNFFSPDYRPPGVMAAAGLTGPEFQLMNSYTSISTINFWFSRIEWDYVFDLPPEDREIKGETHIIDQPQPDLTYELSLVGDINALVDHLDLVLTYGSLSAEMRSLIVTTLNDFAASGPADPLEIVRFGIYLFFVCPEYAIQV